MHTYTVLGLLVACNIPSVLGAAYASQHHQRESGMDRTRKMNRAPRDDTAAMPTPVPKFVSAGYGGSGCKANAGTPFITRTEEQISISGEPLAITVEPGSNARDFCLIDFVPSVGDGWQFAIKLGPGGFVFGHNASMQLDDGVTAEYKESIEISGAIDRATAVATFSGPLKQNAVITPKYDPETLIWSPCGGSTMIFHREVRLSSNTNGTGTIRVDVNFDLSATKHFEWRECTN